MDWRSWGPLYEEILAEFHFSRAADEAAADDLAARLDPARVESAWSEARRRLAGRSVTVVGAGDDAPGAVERVAETPLVAADGATTACLETGRRPDLIVTDLDGRVEDEVEAARGGAIVAVHAHGDNGPARERWLGEFPPARLVGTCQCQPPPPLRNHGGFTDGDRSAFLAEALGARDLVLVGFDFSGRVGRYTGTFDPATKPRKLVWARRLLDEIRRGGTPVRFG